MKAGARSIITFRIMPTVASVLAHDLHFKGLGATTRCWLATTVTLYDALDKDIRRAFPSIHQAVEKAIVYRFPDDELCQGVAKTVAVLQILGNLPVTVDNVAALMQPTIAAGSWPTRLKRPPTAC